MLSSVSLATTTQKTFPFPADRTWGRKHWGCSDDSSCGGANIRFIGHGCLLPWRLGVLSFNWSILSTGWLGTRWVPSNDLFCNILPQSSGDFDPEADPEPKKTSGSIRNFDPENFRKLCILIRKKIMLRSYIEN